MSYKNTDCNNGSNVLSLKNRVILKSNDRFRALGCVVCLSNSIGQNEMGNPVVNGFELINITDLYKEIELDVAANLWLCPNCHKPFEKLLPAFSNYIKGDKNE